MVEGLKSHTLAKGLQSGAALLENSALSPNITNYLTNPMEETSP
jgi:hypothetical protein